MRFFGCRVLIILIFPYLYYSKVYYKALLLQISYIYFQEIQDYINCLPLNGVQILTSCEYVSYQCYS